MPSIDEEINRLQEEIHKTQYNKATEHHIGRIKAKLAKLEKTKEERSRKGGGGTGFFIKKGIYPTVALVGPPSVGKSSILNSITNADSRVGEFDFTTLTIVPGIMEYKDMKFRILDLPGIIEGANEGKGRGREVISVLRNVDLILIILDPFKFKTNYILNELNKTGIRINQHPPKMSIIYNERGGINITTTKNIELDMELFSAVAREFGVVNADIVIRENLTVERFIDGLLGNRSYIDALFILNKSDLPEFREAFESLRKENIDPVPLSINKHKNVTLLKSKIASSIKMIKIFLQAPDKENLNNEPLVLRAGSSVEDVCRAVHRDFIEKFKFAQITGKSVKFPNQQVGLDHIVENGDKLTLYIKKG